ncbi:MAG: hypothetical protein KBC21_00120 [Candidatus Pacebacteria bacterium]|nr:hypothetical protein [Candidatus Paceibacterota bacterium]
MKRKEFLLLNEWPEHKSPLVIPKLFQPKFSNDILTYGVWPLYFDIYYGDKEPILNDKRIIPHVISWYRKSDTGVTKKKYSWFGGNTGPRNKIGILHYAPLDEVPYYHDWARTTKKERAKWLRGVYKETYDVEEIDIHNFIELYKKSFSYKKNRSAGMLMSRDAETRSAFKSCRGTILKDKGTGKVVAGLLSESSYSSGNSYYSIGFTMDKAGSSDLSLFLIVEWIEREIPLGIEHFNFGAFWQEGKPESWKGFSFFKSKFGVTYYDLPPVLTRFA